MWRAALRVAQPTCAAAVMLVVLQVSASTAQAGTTSTRRASIGPAIRGIVVGGSQANRLGVTLLRKLKKAGVNTLFLDPGSVGAARRTLLARRAGAAGLRVFVSFQAPGAAWRTGQAQRVCARNVSPTGTCSVITASPMEALRIAHDRGLGLLGVRLVGPVSNSHLGSLVRSGTRVVAFYPLSRLSKAATWKAVVQAQKLGIRDFVLTHVSLRFSSLPRLHGVTTRISRLPVSSGDAAQSAPASKQPASVPAPASGGQAPVAPPAAATTPSSGTASGSGGGGSGKGASQPQPQPASVSAPVSGGTQHAVANLWVDGASGACTRSSSLVGYSAGSACASMQAAMTAAQGGDTVVVKCGTYPTQTISSGTKASVVTFYAATYDQAVTASDAYSATTCVYVANLSLSGVDNVHIYGIQATPTPDERRTDAHLTYAGGGSLSVCASGCSGFTTRDISVDGFHGRSMFSDATNLTIDHSSFGGWDACYDTNGQHLASGNSGTEDGFRFWQGTGGSPTPSNDTVEHTVFHDIIMGVNNSEQTSVCTFGALNGPHADCMQNNGGNNVTVADNIFFNCPSSDIQWNPFNGATVGTQLIENNYFGPGGNNGTVLGAQGTGYDCSGITVRNNFYDGVGINPGGSPGGCTLGAIQIYGNYIGQTFCIGGAGVNYHDNAFPSGGCGTASKLCTPTYVQAPLTVKNYLGGLPNPRQSNSDTCLAHSDTASSYPATDIEENARPNNANLLPDIGPYQTQ